MRKWLIRISLSLLVLIVLVVIIVQAVLWSPLPRRIVTKQIEKELGLRISCDSLSTGWLGKSELTDVSLGLPLSSADFLKVKSLKIKHSSLIGLALGYVTVDSVEVDDPVVEVVQNEQGQWNLQQVAILLGRLGGGGAAASNGQATQQSSSSGKGVPTLPMIKLVNGTVHITDNQKHALDLKPVNVSGNPSGVLVWNYDLSIGDPNHPEIALNGKLAPGGDWQHTITLTAHDLDALVKDWGIPTTYAANLNATWFGQLANGKVNGTLVLNQMTARGVPTLGNLSVGGSIGVQNDGAMMSLHPNQLVVNTTDAAVPVLKFESGNIFSDATGLHAQSVKLAAFGGLANVDAAFDPHSQAVDLKANWSGLSLAKRTSQSGSLTASLREPFANQPVIHVELESNGTVGDTAADAIAPPSHWNAKLDLTGQGSSWKSIDWVLAAPRLTYGTGRQTIDLSQLSAHVSQRLPAVELTDLSLPPGATGGQASANFTSSGRADFKTRKWNFDASGGFNTSFQNTPVPVTVALHAHGDGEQYDLQSLTVGVSDVTVAVDGSYAENRPTPVSLHVLLSQEKRLLPDAPIQGELAGDFNIVGNLFKEGRRFRPYLTTTGDLRSSDLVFFGRTIGDVDIKLQGISSTPDQPNDDFGRTLTQLKTTQFYLFQAPWTLTADYPNPQGVLEVAIETHRLPIAELAKFAKMRSGVGGQITQAKWIVKIPSLSLDDLDLRSDIHLENLAAAGLTANSVDITTTLHDGQLRMDPLLAKNGDGTLTTTASFDLKHPRHLITETTIERWPYQLSAAVSAQLRAHLNLDVDLKAKPSIGASGSLTAATDLLLHTTRLAHADLSASVRDQAIDLDNISGNILTGTFNGAAKLDLRKPLQATGQIRWQDVDAATFATIIPAMEGAGGKFSGTITMAPARDPRPLEPVRVDINVASVGGHFRSMNIGGDGLLAVHAVAYANTDRAVLDHSDIYVAGGLVHLWARVDDRSGAGISAQGSVSAENLQLDQIAHIDPKITKPMPGIVNMQLTSIRSGAESTKLLVLCHADLTQTDLVNFGPIAALYNVMNAGGGNSPRPEGSGSVDLSFEQNLVHINSFEFYNRGIDAHGLATIGPLDYDDLEATPIGGQVVGTIRTLKNSNIKIFQDFDQYFAALESNLTTINVTGTINNMNYPSAGLADIGTAMRELLVGSARHPAGQP
jgi:hypothetical protein